MMQTACNSGSANAEWQRGNSIRHEMSNKKQPQQNVIDNIFVVAGGEVQVKRFHTWANGVHPDLGFTVESSPKELHFLNTCVHLDGTGTSASSPNWSPQSDQLGMQGPNWPKTIKQSNQVLIVHHVQSIWGTHVSQHHGLLLPPLPKWCLPSPTELAKLHSQ